jgi:hypothetical protein
MMLRLLRHGEVDAGRIWSIVQLCLGIGFLSTGLLC